MEHTDRLNRLETQIKTLAASQRKLALSISNLASAVEESNNFARQETLRTDADISVLIFTVICNLIQEGGLDRHALISALDKAVTGAAAAASHQPVYSPTESVLEALRNWQRDMSPPSPSSNLQ
ncbi:hypothetical protein [Amorphus sp. MBR-141]